MFPQPRSPDESGGRHLREGNIKGMWNLPGEEEFTSKWRGLAGVGAPWGADSEERCPEQVSNRTGARGWPDKQVSRGT